MKKSLNIEIDCAICANKCQEKISKIEGVISCNVNFIMQKMTVEYNDDLDFANLLKQIIKVGKSVDSDFEVLN